MPISNILLPRSVLDGRLVAALNDDLFSLVWVGRGKRRSTLSTRRNTVKGMDSASYDIIELTKVVV